MERTGRKHREISTARAGPPFTTTLGGMISAIAWTVVLLSGIAIGMTVANRRRAFEALLVLGLALFAVGLGIGPDFNKSDQGTAQLLLLNADAGSIVQLFGASYASLIASCVVAVRRSLLR